MVNEEYRQSLVDAGLEDLILWDGCDDAILGYATRCGGPTVLVYNYEPLVCVFIAQGMSREEAVEWIDFNVAGAYVGEHTPMILYGLRPMEEPGMPEFEISDRTLKLGETDD